MSPCLFEKNSTYLDAIHNTYKCYFHGCEKKKYQFPFISVLPVGYMIQNTLFQKYSKLQFFINIYGFCFITNSCLLTDLHKLTSQNFFSSQAQKFQNLHKSLVIVSSYPLLLIAFSFCLSVAVLLAILMITKYLSTIYKTYIYSIIIRLDTKKHAMINEQ